MESNRLTALKTTSLRLRGTSVDILNEEGLDSEGAVTSKSKLQSKVKALSGVDILTATGEYKSTYEILSQIADVWEDINDMDQAALLELISGKRNSSVIAAILQNPKELKEAFEDANDAEGSALRENEKYLDSIQGRIDLFTNAIQTMWKNALDSDVVKWFIDLGTKIIQVIDKLGLIPSILITIATISMVKNKMGPLAFFTELFNGLQKAPGKIKGLITSLFGITAATSAYTAETLTAAVANGALSASEAASIASKNGLALATTNLTAAEAAEILMNSGVAKADALAMVAKLGLTNTTQALSLANIEAAVSAGTLTATQGTQIASALGLTAANTGLAASFGALLASMWPVLIVIGAIAAGWALWKYVLDPIINKTEKLAEKLNDLKLELQDIQSEFDSVNSKLETTKDRMAELLAMDSLSFTEEEELKNLQKQNDELQRRLDLLTLERKQKQEDASKAFVEAMNSDLKGKDFYEDGSKASFWSNLGFYASGVAPTHISESEAIDIKIQQYQDYVEELADIDKQIIDAGGANTKKGKKLSKKRSQIEKNKTKIETYMVDKISELKTQAEDIDYGINDETDAWLDYIYNLEDKWAITNDGPNAKTNAIKRIFNKDENKELLDSINGYVDQLAKGDQSAKDSISSLIDNNAALVADLQASGIKIDEATDYFAQFASEAHYATIEGKIKEIDEAVKKFNSAINNVDTSNIDTIKQALTDKGWVDTEGNLMSDVIAEYFGGEDGGISEETRVEIERLVKQIYDGKITVQDALKSFELFGIQSVIDLQVVEVKTNFKEVFSDLTDADGIINTFKELGDAINSTVGALDAFNQAQADVADKGFVSIQTALQLMEYTDDYGSVLEVVDGKLQLTKDAEKNLIKTRIEAIKVSAQTAVADAQAAYDKAKLAVQSYRSAMVEEASAKTVATAWQKIVGVAAGIKNVLENIWSGKSISELYNSGYNTYLEDATGLETKYDDSGLQALEEALTEAGNKLQESKDNAKIADALTADNIEDIFKPSDKQTPEEVAKTHREELLEYYDNRLAANQAKQEQIQNEIELAEQMGMKADKSYYDEKLKLMAEQETLLKQKKADLLVELNKTTEGSDEWWEIAKELNDIEGELDDVTSSIVDLQDAIGEIDTYQFDEFSNRLDKLTSKLQTMRDLMAPNGEEDWFDDEGGFTAIGTAVLGSYLQELEMYKQGLAQVETDMAEFGNTSYNDLTQSQRDALAERGIHSEQEYYDWVTKLDDAQLDYLSNINDTEIAIGDMYEASIDAVEEYTQTLVESYNDYIDACKEALDAERDLYSFKKDVQKQNKDIAATERRIAALAGSTNAADIAERRKLEAQLAEQKESLDDTYYEHSKESQQNALDAEAQAYEESMNRFVENLRTSLDSALGDMEAFLAGVSASVMLNAQTVKDQYVDTGATLDDALVKPWDEAIVAIGKYETDGLSQMNTWTTDSSFFGQFAEGAKDKLTGFWGDGIRACDHFEETIDYTLSDISTNIETNVAKWREDIKSAYDDIQDTDENPPELQGQGDIDNGAQKPTLHDAGTVTAEWYQVENAEGMKTNSLYIDGVKYYKAPDGYYYKFSDRTARKDVQGNPGFAYKKGTKRYQYYAKGTLGTKQSGFAITDESWIGEEITLAAGKNGTLQYLKKGSAVLPSDISANLIEWGKLNPNMLNMTNPTGVNIISNAIIQPNYDFKFDSLVHVDHCDQSTVKDLERMVDNKLNDFGKQLNYSIKKFTR